MTAYTLSPPLLPAALNVIRATVKEALQNGEQRLSLDLDALNELETPVIAFLIRLLRDARQHGATVVLRASNPSLLAALRVTALDKLFTIEAASQPLERPFVAERVPGHTRGRKRILAACVGALIGFIANRASAATEIAPEEIVANIISQNADMHSYQAQVRVDLRLRSFPYVSQHLDGTTYFKRPNNFEVVFDRVPSYAKGFDKIYSDIDDPISWMRRFDLSLAGRRMVAGHHDIVVRLVQKVRGMIDHEDVAVDPASWQIDEMDWHYYNGGVIAMSQEYQSVGGFTVLAKQHATIRIPFVHAAAEATYGDYLTNVAIDDSVFTREKR